MKRVARFGLPLPKEGIEYARFSLYLPSYHQVVKVGILGYYTTPSLWILFDGEDTLKTNVNFFVCSTNTLLPKDVALTHVGTFANLCAGKETIWHVFELIGSY